MELRQLYRWMPLSLMMSVLACSGRTDIDWFDIDELDAGVDAAVDGAARDPIGRDNSDARGHHVDSAPGDTGVPEGFPSDVVMDTWPRDSGFPDGTFVDTDRPDVREASVTDTGRPDV